MVALEISHEEVQTGKLTSNHLAKAVDAVRTDGFVVLENIVETSHLDLLRRRMVADAEKVAAREDAPFNWIAGNIQQSPPPFPPYLFRDVLVNDLVIEVTNAVLGPGVKNGFYSGNTAMPGGERQPVHTDIPWAPHEDGVDRPFSIVVNIPVVDVSMENGSTEIWPGTHVIPPMNTGGDIKITPEMVEARRAISPPIQPSMRLGSVLIRDMRMWHAGMPNHTQQPRPMIAMIHDAADWGNTGPITLPKGTEDLVAHPLLNTVAVFVGDEIDYIRDGAAYEYAK